MVWKIEEQKTETRNKKSLIFFAILFLCVLCASVANLIP